MFLGSLIINQVLIISVVNTLNFVSLLLLLLLFFYNIDCIKKPARGCHIRPIVPLEGGNSMNAKERYSSHSPNSPLRGYEGDRDRGTERY